MEVEHTPMSDKPQGKTLYELWESNDLPVKIHEATEYLFNAYKYGASGHIVPLKKAFPDYFVDPWDVFPKKSQPSGGGQPDFFKS